MATPNSMAAPTSVDPVQTSAPPTTEPIPEYSIEQLNNIFKLAYEAGDMETAEMVNTHLNELESAARGEGDLTSNETVDKLQNERREQKRQEPISATPAPSWYPEFPDRAPGGIVDKLFGPTIEGMAAQPSATQYGGGDGTEEVFNEQTGKLIERNLDVPGSVGGAAIGTAIGAPFFPPLGGIAGGMIGGAIGGGAGVELSNYLREEGDEGEAKDTLTVVSENAAIDGALYTAGLYFKPLGKIMGLVDDEMVSGFKNFFKDSPAGWSPAAKGTNQSLEEAQGFLNDASDKTDVGGLTAYQAGATGVKAKVEALASVGFLSGQRYLNKALVNAAKLKDGMMELMYKTIDDVSVNSLDLPAGYKGALDAGKAANTEIFQEGLKAIKQKSGGIRVSKRGIVKIVTQFAKSKAENVGTDLSPEAQGVIDGVLELYDNPEAGAVFDVSSLLLLKTNLNQTMSGLLDPMFKTADRTKAYGQLVDLSKQLDTQITAILKAVDPESAEMFNKLNLDFSVGQANMYPPLTEKFVTAATKGDYAAVGVMFRDANASQVDALYKSLDEAYVKIGLMEEMGTYLLDGTYDKARRAFKYNSPEEAKQAFQQGYLQGKVGTLESVFEPESYATLAKQLEDPWQAAQAKAVLGDDYPRWKLLVNTLHNMTRSAQGEQGVLVLRGAEALAGGQAVQGATSGDVGLMLKGLGSLGAILKIPVLLQHMTSSPAAIKALLTGKSRIRVAGGSVRATGEIMEETFKAIWDTMTPEQQEEARDQQRGINTEKSG